MRERLSTYLQYITPQHTLSWLMGKLAQVEHPGIKDKLIRYFIRRYHIDMSLAAHENPEHYKNFNHFFIRTLKPSLRPIDADPHSIVSPVDGCVAAAGKIEQHKLLQAKDMYFSLESLLGGDMQLADTFKNGQFATLYLSPKDYHRVHMPLTGRLKKSIFVPGKLFSVNRMTSELIPNLYARNERLITLFDTDEAGLMAVILVGAIVVGSMQTVWMKSPMKAKHISITTPTNPITLNKGAELGHFKIGSTVVLLFPNHKTEWAPLMQAGQSLQFGESIGQIIKSS